MYFGSSFNLAFFIVIQIVKCTSLDNMYGYFTMIDNLRCEFKKVLSASLLGSTEFLLAFSQR